MKSNLIIKSSRWASYHNTDVNRHNFDLAMKFVDTYRKHKQPDERAIPSEV